MENKMNFTVPCLFGLESVIKFELSKLGAVNITPENGRVNFEGDERTMVRANLWLRTGERVSIVLGTFRAVTFTELFDGVNGLPFEKYIGSLDEFPVKGWSIDSQLASVPSCQSIIKKAVVKRLGSIYHKEIFEETGALHQITFSLHKDMVTVMLDTTGASLYKRGYRDAGNIAPIRETLAAGVADFAQIREHDQVYDPMCGSGTLLIEAALRALNIAPGLRRGFAVEQWQQSDPELWAEERKLAESSIKNDCNFKAYGSDIDPRALAIAKNNAKRAGVEDRIVFKQGDIKNLKLTAPAKVVCNPPYGERLLDEEQAAEIFKTMGKVMPKTKDISYYIFGPSDDFENNFGRKADKRRKLYNGMIPCQLYMYFK